MCKMNIKVEEEFSTARDNSWCPHTKNKTKQIPLSLQNYESQFVKFKNSPAESKISFYFFSLPIKVFPVSYLTIFFFLLFTPFLTVAEMVNSQVFILLLINSLVNIKRFSLHSTEIHPALKSSSNTTRREASISTLPNLSLSSFVIHQITQARLKGTEGHKDLVVIFSLLCWWCFEEEKTQVFYQRSTALQIIVWRLYIGCKNCTICCTFLLGIKFEHVPSKQCDSPQY